MATIERYETKGGATLYRVRYRTPDNNRSTQKRGFKTKRDAQQWANNVESAKTRGEYIAPAVGKITIGELDPAWLDRQRGHPKASTLRCYELSWGTHVAQLGRCPHLRRSLLRCASVGVGVVVAARSGGGADRVFGAGARILDDAVRDRLIASNTARGVKLPKLPPSRKIYLTAEQLQRLADESGHRYKSLVLALGIGGLRLGEAAALRVCDVDFLRRRVELRRNAVKVGNTFVVGSLKSHKNRSVALPGFVVDELARACEGNGRDDLIWPSPRGGYISGPSLWKTSWLAMAVVRCQKADPTFPRVTPHDLRHTAAWLAISAGANPKVVQRMLGHASAAMTLDVYADLFESDLESVAENVAKMWPLQAKQHTHSTPKTFLPARTCRWRPRCRISASVVGGGV
jgi:integrase